MNRMCGSSQQAVHFAAQAILAGDMHLVIAGGTEMMSHQALGADYPAQWPEDFPFQLVHQGISAEMMAEKMELEPGGIGRFCLPESFTRHARHTGRSLRKPDPAHSKTGWKCGGYRRGGAHPPDRERMRALKTVFKENGVVTAGNSSQISDGAGALLLASAEAVGRYNLTPRARLVSRYVVGSDPVLMLDAPIPATRQALSRAGLTWQDMDVIEINEAFASVVLAWAKELKIEDMERVNPNGGAIALGHPLGATGAVLMIKLVHELERSGGRYGLQTMCIGHGMATATVLEKV